MQIIVLIVFAVVLSIGAPEGPRLKLLGWPALAGALAVYIGGAAALTWWQTRRGLRELMAGAPLDATARRQHRRLLVVGVWFVAGMASLLLCGATDRLRELPGVAVLPLVDAAVLLAAFLLAAVTYWRISFRFDRAVRWQVEQELMLAGLPVRPGWSAGQHLEYNIRHSFLFIAVPVGLIVLVHDLVDLVAPHLVPAESLATATAVAKVLGAAGVFFIAPVLLVNVWRTRPMPDGELRRRLERLCGEVGLTYRRILIWDTGGVLANAAVMGLHRSVRYVLISDALLEQMDDREIVAVFGHEAGHVKGHHMGYFLVFIAAAMGLCTSVVTAGGMIAERLGAAALAVEIGEVAVMAALTFVIIGLGFGRLSRLFERQADAYGAWCAGVDARLEGHGLSARSDLGVGGPWFINALETIARLNGMSRTGHNWRHGSIAGRVQFLLDAIAAGWNRIDIDRRIRRLKRAGWAMVALAVLSAAATWPRWWS